MARPLKLSRIFESAILVALAAGGSAGCFGATDTIGGPGPCPTQDGGVVPFDGGFPPITTTEADGAVVVTNDDAGVGATPSAAQCEALCAPLGRGNFFQCTYTTQNGAPAVSCASFTIPCHTGRRPSGMLRRTRARGTLGDYFAKSAELEAASVDAFCILADELLTLRAPRALSRRSLAAARDEVRHARVMTALARRAGSSPRPTGTPRRRVRSLSAIARENAVEGCVRETYGALVAMWQAQSAVDERVRAAMARIAIDETRHAELAWDVMRWAESKLSIAERRRIERAMAREVASLERAVGREAPESWRESAGLPSAPEARALLGQLRASLWG